MVRDPPAPLRPMAGERLPSRHARRQVRRGDAEPLRRRHRGLFGRGRRQRALDGVADELVDRAGIAKAHLGLLRMHVDVDASRVERQPQRIGRLAVVMQDVAIRFAQRVRQHAVAHEAAVDEDVLRVGPSRGVRRAGRRSPVRAARRPHRRRPAPRAARTHRRAALRRARAGRPPAADAARGRCACSVNATSGCASAMRRNASSQCAHSVASVRRNLRRAGVLKYSSSIGDRRSGRERRRRHRADGAAFDLDAPRVRLVPRARRDRERARPRRSTPAPRRESRASRSPRDRAPSTIFDVACRATASARSSRSMPAPLSATRMRLTPPAATSTSICVAPRVERVLEQLLQRRRRAARRPRRPRSG